MKIFTPIFSLLAIWMLFAGCDSAGDNSLIPLDYAGKIIPKNSSEISASPFGIQAGTEEDSLLAKAAAIGVKWTRLHAGWEGIEKEKGVYDWHETDRAFEAVLKYGITPFVTIGNGNRIYSGTGNYDDPKLAAIYGESPAPPVGSPEELDAWLRFVSEVITRYKDRISYWEIWNEPTHRKYWGAPPNAEDYGRLVRATTETIRSIQPDAKIIAGSTAGIKPEYCDEFLSHCDPDQLDIISFHHYAIVPELRAYPMEAFLRVIDKHNPDLEIWQGECGYPSSSRTIGFRSRAPWGLNIQAKWLLRQSFVDTYFCRASLSNYFKLVSDGSLTPDMHRGEMTGLDKVFGFPERGGSSVHWLGEGRGVNEKCILHRKDYQPKPAYHAYQNLCASWTRPYQPDPVEYEVEVLDPGIFYGIGEYEDVFPSVPLVASYTDGQGNNLVAWWLPWNAQEYLPQLARINITLPGLFFEDPVLLDPLSGTVYDLDIIQDGRNCRLKEVVLADYPFIMIERSTIEMH